MLSVIITKAWCTATFLITSGKQMNKGAPSFIRICFVLIPLNKELS